MDVPRFDKKNLNPRLAPTDIGDAFQRFVHEVLLPEHPQLHRFPGGGKDGGIDLIDSSSGTCLVVECKVVGDDGYAEAEKRWKTVRNNLREHLRDPSGPTSGQSQYRPWYSADKPIAEYVFCVSSSLSHEQQRRDLEETIAEFFWDLARQYPHLSHLSNLKVSIIDWNRFSTRLRQRPHSVFRWFPSSRPNGLVPIDEAVDVGTFRAYLTDAKLPYYSLAEHLQKAPAPESVGILSEESLLAHLENSETTGLIISGRGGIGKSRLTLELGWLALRKGWTVLRVQSRLKENALEELAERLTPESPALLLVDYIETQTDFGELVETLNVLNDSGVARLRYIASCRTGYYHQAIAASSRHLPVDLTPPPGAVALDWYSGYHRETIAKILTKAGLPLTQQHLAVCHDVPILAVFLAYLHTAGRSEDLAELLTEVEFGRWVAKRVQLSFPAEDVSRKLALLVPLFPITDLAAKDLDQDRYRPVFDRLATDGWIEKVPANAESLNTWVTAHDVLADQILLSYLRGIPNTVDAFVSELFAFAADMDCLSSAIVSLQRIVDSPPLNAVKWSAVITNAISTKESGWRSVREVLIRTSLLPVPEQIALLHSHDALWTNAEQEVVFQNSLGWFARWLVKVGEKITNEQKKSLVSWISKAAPLADKNNFVITWGLRLAPELVKEAALHWIRNRPTVFQTHYVMVAWLEVGLSTEFITDSVRLWCRKFSRISHLSFVARAWLDAGGKTALVQDAIQDWLVDHRTEADADFVYKAWLDAGGDKDVVRDGIHDWLVKHKTTSEARFVYDSWLDAGGDKDVVRDAIHDWLVKHKTDSEARFVYSSWLDAGGDKALIQEAIKAWLVEFKTDPAADFIYKAWLSAGGDKEIVRDSIRAWLSVHSENPADHLFRSWIEAGGERELVWDAATHWLRTHHSDESAVYMTKFIARQRDLTPDVVKDVLAWCRTFPTNEDALWRLTQLGENLLRDGIELDVVSTAEAVVADLLRPESRPGIIAREQVTTLFSYLIDATPLRPESLRDRVDLLFVKWLRHPLSFGTDPKPHFKVQRISFIRRLSRLIDSGALDPVKDREPLTRFLQWLNQWDLTRKQRVSSTLDELRLKHPAPDLWDIVR